MNMHAFHRRLAILSEETSAEFCDKQKGNWVTIGGSRACVRSGKIISGPPIGDTKTPAAQKVKNFVNKLLGRDTPVEASDDGENTHLRARVAGKLFSVPLAATGTILKAASLGMTMAAGLLDLASTMLDAAERMVGVAVGAIGRVTDSILSGLEALQG